MSYELAETEANAVERLFFLAGADGLEHRGEGFRRDDLLAVVLAPAKEGDEEVAEVVDAGVEIAGGERTEVERRSGEAGEMGRPHPGVGDMF